MVTAKVRFGRISFDGSELRIYHKGSIAAHTETRVPVSAITGVSSSKAFLSPTFVEVWVPGGPTIARRASRGYAYRFSFRKRHARAVADVLNAAGWPL